MNRERRLIRLHALALLAGTLAVYLPALTGGYLWDDQLFVRDNVALRSLAGLVDLWRIPSAVPPQYYPLTFTSFWIEYQLWGDTTLGYHVVNVLLHGVNAVLVWRILARLEVPGALLAAWIFALHPVNVESVAWIAERKNVLAGCFGLLAVRAWLDFLDRRSARALGASVVCFAAALLAKTVVCTLPVVLGALAWWRQPRAWRRQLLPLLPFVVLAIGAAIATVWSEHPGLEPELPLPQLGLVERVLVAARALWFYVGKLAWPVDLVSICGHWPVDARAWTAWVFPAGAVLALLVCAVGQRFAGRGPCVAVVAFGALLAPVLGLIDFNFMRFSYVADHFQYFASIPLIALAVAGGVWLGGQRLPLRAVAVLLVLLLGAASWGRAAVHRDQETRWRDNTRRNPGCAPAFNRLGNVLLEQHRLVDAAAAFTEATRLDPQYADAHNNWATVLKEQGRVAEAVARYREALRLKPGDPVVQNNLGVALQLAGDDDGALTHLAEAVRLAPTYEPAQVNWGNVLLARGDAGRPWRITRRRSPSGRTTPRRTTDSARR